MNVTGIHVRVLGALWCLVAVLFGASVPFVASMSCTQIMNPAGAEQRWYILHIFGGSVFWMHNVVLALAIGAALITFRFRPVIVLFSTWFICTCLAICALMARAPETFPFNVTLFSSSILIAAFGIATFVLVMRGEVGEFFKDKRLTSSRKIFVANAPKPSA